MTDHDEPDQRSALPRAAQVYIGMVVLLGAVALGLAVAATVAGETTTTSPATLLVIVSIGACSIVLPLRFHHDGAVQGFNLTVASYLALLLLAGDALAVVLTAVTAVVGYAVSTRSPVKTIFNTAQEVLWAGAATFAGRAVLGGPVAGDVLALEGMLALLVSAVVAVALNVLVTSELFHHLEGEPRLSLVAAVSGPVTAVVLAGNTTAGVLLIILGDRSPVAVVLAVPLLAGLLLGYRGFATQQESARRAAAMQRTSSQLLEAALDDAALHQAIDGLRELFGADRAVLDAAGLDEQTGAGTLSPELAIVRRTGTTILRTTEGGLLVAPVVLDGRIVGSLAVAGRHGLDAWGAADLALLSTIAGEVAATLRARQLFGQLEQERAALEAETQRLGDILRSASDGIVLLDADGRVQACNPAMAALAGVRPDDALGRRWDDVLRLEHDDSDGVRRDVDVLEDALAGAGSLERASVLLRQPGGESRWLRCSAAPVQRDGVLDGVVLVAVDVTREREVEELRGDFLATVSHELRTPLTPLRGFLSVLSGHGDRLDRDRVQMIHGSMDKQLRRLEDLIGDLLLVAEVDRSSPQVEMAATDIGVAVTDILEGIDPASRARVSLVTQSEERAMADAGALRRIVRSLVSNALKHTDGPIEVAVEHAPAGIIVAVADRGPGVAPWAREVIFEPFRRLGDHLHRTQGPGLGLAIARALVEAQGGTLHVADRAGGGAVFTAVLMPVTAPGDSPVDATRSARSDDKIGEGRR